ncbi:hypothetical protein [Paenibacillus sp. 598K]|uniref:hypothetical protein n=1 Tax=Paenibacillus sp. 598K TaxID=1117987 RepID=UPI001C87394E|nr:hypothetical protein [Paenibacillus sp. 598K]
MWKKTIAIASLLSLAVTGGGASVGAYSPQLNPFPIGIFWPPGPAATSNQTYADIAGMGANFVVGGNGINSYATNDAALQYAQANGVRILVDDERLVWREQAVTQTTTGMGLNVSSSNRIGQTITTPSGTGWGLNTVKLYIDKDNWSAGTTLTLSLYDSPQKTNLLASNAITGPVDTFYPVFRLHTAVASNTQYYLELTSNSATPTGWVVTSAGDSYSGGRAYSNGTPENLDLWFDIGFGQRAYNDSHQPSAADIADIASHYRTRGGVQGYHVYDEPSIEHMARIDQTIRSLRQTDPDHMSFVNLFPNYASEAQLGLDRFTGEFISSSNRLGQTLTTKEGQTRIDTVQWWVDHSQWGSGEQLTLRLWNGPAKTTLIAEKTLSSSTTDWPVFDLQANVSPSTSYYMELTHNGGGNNSIGWVVRSHANEKWNNDGTAYINGSAIAADFWYTVNQTIQGRTYEDYVYRWVNKQPDVLSFDHYPFLIDGSMRQDYYANLEVIRRQALRADVDFWSYIQSVGVTGVWRAPSESDMRYQIYTNLAYGAKGYIYFTYQTPASSGGESFFNGLLLPDGTKNASYTWAQQLNGEVAKLGPTLMGLTSNGVYHNGTVPSGAQAVPASFYWKAADAAAPVVIGSFVDGQNRKYILVVNRDNANARTLSFNVNPRPSAVTEVSKQTGAETSTNYNAATGVISASFQPGEGKLYALPAGY